MKILTIKQALKEGYIFYDQHDDEYGIIKELKEDELNELIKSQGKVLLVSKVCTIGEWYPDGSDLIEYIFENMEICDFGLDETEDIMRKYESRFDKLLDKMKNEIIKKNATKTYELTDICLIPEIENF